MRQDSSRFNTTLCRLAVLCGALLCHLPARAQASVATESKDASDVISSDRPGFVESSTVMKPGRFQLETGIGYARSQQNTIEDKTRDQTYTLPFLLRYGSADNWEFRLESDGWTRQRQQQDGQATATKQGYSDLAVGIKWHMQDGDENTGKPAIAWLAHLDLTTGSQAFRAAAASPSLRMVAEWELANEFSFAMMPGIAWDKNDLGKRYTKGILGFTLSRAINQQWNSYVELSAEQLAAKHNGGTIISYGAGLSYLVNIDTQMDISVTKLKTGNAPDIQIGLGFSMRF